MRHPSIIAASALLALVFGTGPAASRPGLWRHAADRPGLERRGAARGPVPTFRDIAYGDDPAQTRRWHFQLFAP